MRHLNSILTLALLSTPTIFGAAGILPPKVTVGDGLEVIANVTLEEAAPPGGLEVTLTSGDPSRLLFSKTPEGAGTPVIQLAVREGYSSTVDYYIQGFGKSGMVAYTATAPGFAPGAGTVTLAPSGLIFARTGMGLQNLLTTTGVAAIDVVVYSGLLDSELNYLHPQPVAGGRSMSATLTSSNPKVGVIGATNVTIAGGSASAAVQFRPVTPGETTLTLTMSGASNTASRFARTVVTVMAPGMALTDDVSIGHDLSTAGTVSLGEHAPAEGVVVTINSSDPAKLLLSKTATEPGSDCIQLAIPPGGVNAHYYLQGVADHGSVTYTATAPGFRPRTATVALTPSGVVIGGPQGPPDEAELLNKEIAEGPHGFVTRLTETPTVVSIYSVQLDPITHRGADLTVQPVRPGMTIKAILKNSNPSAGSVKETELTIPAGSSSAVTHFIPAGVGQTVISLPTPAGFTQAANSTSLTVTVKN